MNKEKVQLIIKNLELLIDCLKSELDNKDELPFIENTSTTKLVDYDEVFFDEDNDYHSYVKMSK